MKRLALLLSLVVAPSVAFANVEVGGIAGLHVFSDHSRLGVEEKEKGATDEPNSLKNSSLFGLRLGIYFNDKIGVEIEGGVIPTEPRHLVFDVYNIAYRANLVYQFRAADPSNRILPFILAGAGVLQIVDSKQEDIIKKDSVIGAHIGIGVKYRANYDWGVRLDARVSEEPSSKEGGGIAFDFEVLASIYKEFGRKHGSAPIVAEPPKVDQDPDKDGILGAADKCPNEAEDKDGFEDEDGCPDLDNDKDGVADTADKCPTDPEDKDGFQDDDGCPDPDNDGDGVPDAADKCPTDQETRNGFQDDDGCPDEIPAELKKFTGVIQGITFKTGDVALLPASNKTLDKAVAVLTQFTDVKLEIQGHTDDVPLKPKKGAKYDTNEALSQGRADSVKAYFVSKGVDESRLISKGYGDTSPSVDPKGLKGAALNAARAKNRRVEFRLVQAEAATAPATAPTEPTPAPAPAPAPAPEPAPAQ